ncbi:lon-related putative ATP-dependent protease [Sulfuritortus calidifontis]|uniref:endopeptidase La n=1 Tax=Sulfuritortus calidifontis TaxID=1914471 RepID=A0A4R3K0N6_9PROT|nr:ATP-binding protein [Sulfuritortus calidifontis]TCS73375.1 lon-related putative ATP-dependent protease [Sulfuritortus calidifontis]
MLPVVVSDGVPAALPAEKLYGRCDLGALKFKTTTDLPDLPGILGQERAVEAAEFGLAIAREGYNLFVMGPAGTGKRSLVTRLLDKAAAERPTPGDWVYVHNFEQPHKPRAISLPAGRGKELKADMVRLMEDLLTAIPALFESEEYRSRVDQIENEFSEREAAALRELGAEAEKQGIALLRTPSGFGLAPMKDGEVIAPDEFEKLNDEEKQRIARVLEDLHERLHKIIRQAPQWMREKKERIRALNREFSMLAVSHQIGELQEKYRDLAEVCAYLEAVQKDLVDSADELRKAQEAPVQVMGITLTAQPTFRRYQVNLLIDNSAGHGAPVVWPDHPSYPNLVGRIEHIEHLGALVTDFSLIKPGALHQANGGYLVLDAHRLLTQPYAYEALKRSLRSRQVHIDSLGQMLGLAHTVSLEPQPIPVECKVVLQGERLLYYLLYEYDPEFRELFKVVADFEDEMPRGDDAVQHYCRLIATLGRKEGLLPFDRAACARLVEQASREAEDVERLSTNMQNLLDLMREADHLARIELHDSISADAVQAALDARERRTGRVRQRLQEAILRDTVAVQTEGQWVGQINGLSVIQLGDSRFAHPTRITATVRLGEGEVIDISREVNLGGAIHSKGVLTLASFLATRYANNLPLSLSASLAFEQTYGMVEGDSASMAELCALLSAIADVPIRQAIAMTGSVDQYGHMQAIGAVNEKIEGFFDICRARGLDGSHGVVIPEANVKHLMLRSDVVAACGKGQFHIWPVRNVDEAMELLTGLPAGLPDAEGVVPEGSVNYLVAARLIQFSSLRQVFAGKAATRKAATRAKTKKRTTAPAKKRG